jgi:hypothetical protein
MQDERFILPDAMRPGWLTYPKSFCRLVEQGIIHLTPWHLMEGEQALEYARGLASRYTDRQLFPFAFRQNLDEVACWTKDCGEKVFVINDFASPGWENGAVFEDLWSWFRMAVEDTIHWD